MKKLTLSLISAAMFTVGAGISSNADANGTVKKGPVHRHHHHPHKRHHHKPHCPPAPCPPAPCPPACPPCLYKTGIYGGGLIGWSHMEARIKDFFVTNDAAFTSSKLRAKKHNDRFIGELLIGGRHIFESMCDYPTTVALEVSGTWDDHKVNAHLDHFLSNGVFGPNSFIRFKRQYAIIPSLVFGKVFCCNWHAFIKMGVGISRFKTRYIDIPTIGTPTGPFSKKKTQVGFVPALGLEYAVNQFISVVGTATYEWYPNVNSLFHNTITGSLPAFTDDYVRARPRFFSLKVGILVKV